MVSWQGRDQAILPDPTRWGRGYGGKLYTQEEIEESRRYIMETLGRGGLPGYERRGSIYRHPGLQIENGRYLLPAGFDADGPGRQGADPMKLEPNNPTSLDVLWRVLPSVRDYYLTWGYPTDQHDRAVHPLAEQMLDAEIPLCTGYGEGWEGGETVVVDTVVTDGEKVLFNTREDHGKTIPSLVGGYTIPADFGFSLPEWRVGLREITAEGLFRAARRIVKNKTGLHLPADAQFEVVWGIRPWSSYHTLNFWTLTYTVRIRLAKGMSRHLVPWYDAFWHPVNDIAEVYQRGLWPDHKRGYEASTW